MITRLEEEWLRGWRGVLFGELECEEQKSTLNDIAVEIKERIDSDCNVNTDLTLLTVSDVRSWSIMNLQQLYQESSDLVLCLTKTKSKEIKSA